MKIIFLDYDGVVNTIWFQDVNGEPNFNFGKLAQVNNTQAIAWLNKLYRDFEYSIVVSSTWRFNPNYQKFLYKAGLNKNIKILGKTPNLQTIRGIEIKEWLNDNKNNYNIEDFIILDDDADMDDLMDHLIQTNTYRGFGFEEYQKIYKRWDKTHNF